MNAKRPVIGYIMGAPMEYDRDKVDEAVLALLWPTAFDVDQYGARAWKSHDWDAMSFHVAASAL